ncbi:VOC family protein [Dyella silvatica]|uniref:VOC family protein n=1 Tax=Dyella silvatica TaxID=2992128 RepID=UPI0022591666|nr:VOC family protein [Dyella silvatica]
MQLSAYLSFNGDCEAAFKLYEKCLGGKITMMMTYGEAPEEVKGQIPAEVQHQIMHTRLEVGDQVLMGSDCPPHVACEGIKGCSISIGIGDPAQAERIFNVLTEGGKVTMPLAETFWSKKFGMLVDRYGVSWMINCQPAG